MAVLTPEQGTILEVSAKHQNFFIKAYAGTGKTSTFEALARQAHRQHLRCQYLCFNRDAAIDARKRLGRWARVGNAHQLAFVAYGSRFAARLTQSPWHVVKVLLATHAFDRIAWPFPRDRQTHLLAVIGTIERFCQSAAPYITADHVPDSFFQSLPEAIVPTYRQTIVQVAQTLWDHWPEQPDWPVLHDWYLKAWALTRPSLDADVVLFDEAQDANPILVDLVESQAAQKIYAGDPYQQLYHWRGAIDALQHLPHPALPLTCSWRFGTDLATLANWILYPLRPKELIRGRTDRPTSFEPLPWAPAQLFRTNAGILQATITAVSEGKRPAIVGGSAPLVQLLKGFDALRHGRLATTGELAAFTSWDELHEADDAGLLGTLHPVLHWVDAHPDQLTATADQLQTLLTDDETQADLVFSTVHKAKGRQWPSVRIGPDFLPFMHQPPQQPNPTPVLQPEEVHCLYVAVTRAETHLDWTALETTLTDSWASWSPAPAPADSETPRPTTLAPSARGPSVCLPTPA